MRHNGDIGYTICDDDDNEIDVVVEYTYYPGCKGRWYMPNGDPGYPDEPPEIEIYKVYRADDLTEADILSTIPQDTLDDIELAIAEYENEDDYYEED